MTRFDEIKERHEMDKLFVHMEANIVRKAHSDRGELIQMLERECIWEKTRLGYSPGEDDAWSTECGEDFAIIEEWHETPTKFCSNCGGKVVESK